MGRRTTVSADLSKHQKLAMVHQDIYHERRQQTNYLVGFTDLEDSLSSMIRGTDSAALRLAD